MNHLITTQNNKQAVNAKELYLELGHNKAHWKRWYEKNIIGNQFAIENEDWQGFTTMVKTSGGRPSKDFALSIDFAKKLCMLARTEKGEKIRQYFIDVENEYKNLAQNTANIVNFNDANTVLKLAQCYADEQNKRKQLERKVDQLAPKAELADKAIEAEGIYTLSQTAKQLKLGYGRNTMCKNLRELGVFFKTTNEPKQDLIKRGLFEIKLHIIERNNHPNKTVSQTFVTGKGLLYISKLLTEKKTG